CLGVGGSCRRPRGERGQIDLRNSIRSAYSCSAELALRLLRGFGLRRRLGRGAPRRRLGGRLHGLAPYAELGEGLVVELAAHREVSRELELCERRLRLGAEIAIRRAGVEAELAQLLLNAADEAGVRVSRY